MFILTKPVSGINSGNEPFLPLPPYNPTTGENLPPFQDIIVRPTRRKLHKGNLEEILSLLKKPDDRKLVSFIEGLSNEEITDLFKKLAEKINK